MRLIFITAALLFLAGCVAPAQRAANEARFQETIPKCYDAKHCERMFAAARGWIIKHCAMKIQNITDTYTPWPRSRCRSTRQGVRRPNSGTWPARKARPLAWPRMASCSAPG